MKCVLVIGFLLAFAAGTKPNAKGAWKQNTEYHYRVLGRTLAALHDVGDQYTGIILRATLKVQPESHDTLRAQILNPEYAQIHTSLPEGWNSEIAQEQLNYNPLQLTTDPFEIQMKNGVIKGLNIHKNVKYWEVNIIRSIVSQLQVDLQAENLIPSQYNQAPDQNEISAHYKTMEETITGECETLYDVVPVEEYILQSTPEVVPFPHLKGNGKIIQITKTKNYSHCNEIADYHYGLNHLQSEQIYKNLGKILTKSSVSRIVVSGNWDRHTIQSSFTTNKIIVSPLKYNSQKGMVVSHMNVTLTSVKADQPQVQSNSQDSSLYTVHDLLYKYNNTVGSTRSKSWGSFPSLNNLFLSKNKQHRNDLMSWMSSLTEPSYNSFLPHLPPQFIDNKPRSEYVMQTVKRLIGKIADSMQEHNKHSETNALEKFAFLTKIIRISGFKELKQLGDEFYQKREQNQFNTLTWRIFRDAVAQAATGPALLTVRDWIQTNKISNEEAAQVLATLMHNVSYASDEFVRVLYEFVTSKQVQSQSGLNATAILSFSEFVRKSYVQNSHANLNFTVNEFIPYLAQKLDEAITRNDSQNAQVYIRSLGNVAHTRVLAVFKPYLEGHKHVTQFLRVLMIVAMDQLTQTYPKETRSVLYKIIMNVNDYPQVRVAAVYQLIRTIPPISMLQTLAEHTHYELNKHVRSAITSVIQSASKLTQKYAQLSNNAQAVVKLLKPEHYGYQYSKGFLHQYIIQEMNLNYKQYVQSMFAEDSIIPNYLYYSFRFNEADFSRQYINVAAMVSSINALTDIVHNHLWQNDQIIFEKSPSSDAAPIMKSLNITLDQQEQLQANILMQLFGVKRFFAFDNETVAQLPTLIHQVYNKLREGVTIDYTKLYIDEEITISIPTEMSFPFIYSLTTPTSIKANAKMHLNTAEQTERSLNVLSNIDVSSATSTLSKIGFVTPFNHHMYYAGYNKHIQLQLPFAVNIAVNINNMQVSGSIAPLSPHQNQNIFYYRTVPFTTEVDMLKAHVTAGPDYHIIHSGQHRPVEKVFGQENGLVYRARMFADHSAIDYSEWRQNIEKYGIVAVFLPLWHPHTIQHSVVDVEYDANLSSANQVKFNIGYKNIDLLQSKHSNPESSSVNLSSILLAQRDIRQKQIISKIVNSIHNGTTSVYDAEIEFSGPKSVKYVAILATGNNTPQNIMKNILLLSKIQSHKQYQICVSAFTQGAHSSPLNFIHALNDNSFLKSNVHVGYGENCDSGASVQFKVKLDKSEERRRALQSSPLAKLCAHQMEQKMYQHPACANVTAQASTMDRGHIEIEYDRVGAVAQNVTHKIFNLIRHYGYDFLDENRVNATGSGKSQKIEIFAQLQPENYQTMDAIVKTQHAQYNFEQVPVSEWIRSVLAVRPDQYNPFWNIKAMFTRQIEHKPTCVLEQNSANTFNNRTYLVALGQCYHVLLHAGWTNQPQSSNAAYTVLVKDSTLSNNLKELRLIYGFPGYYRQIDLKPAVVEKPSWKHPTGKIYVNNKQIQVPQNGVYRDQDSNQKVWSEIQVLPKGEIKIQFSDDLIIYYDGIRIKTLLDDKYYGNVRGLCGAFNGEPSFDLVASPNCYYRDNRHFVASYALVNHNCHGPAKHLHEQAMNTECLKRTVNYTNVVSPKDAHMHVKCGKRCAISKIVEKTINVRVMRGPKEYDEDVFELDRN